MDTVNLDKIKTGFEQWTESVRDKNSGLYLFNRFTRRPTLLSNCFALLSQELLDGLNNLLPEDRIRLADYISGCQDRHSGLFVDPLLSRKDLLEPRQHNWHYLTWQSTYFSVMALDALEVKPKYKLRFLQAYQDPRCLRQWLRERNWSNPWMESNKVMFLGCLLFYEYQQTSDRRILSLINQMLGWFEQTQDPATGFWGSDRGASLSNAMAGAFHIFLLYHYFKKPIRHQDKIVDSVLSLQQPDGLFVPEGGSACKDLDAIDILVKFSSLSDYRRAEIKAALLRALTTLTRGQNRDGGYSWKIKANGNGSLFSRIIHVQSRAYYSSWKQMPYNLYSSDMWSGWFRPLAIALITSVYSDKPVDSFKFRRLPGLGWHS